MICNCHGHPQKKGSCNPPLIRLFIKDLPALIANRHMTRHSGRHRLQKADAYTRHSLSFIPLAKAGLYVVIKSSSDELSQKDLPSLS